MTNEALKEAVMSDIVLLAEVGINVVLVHGGGPEINSMLDRVGIESKFIGGLRYTDEETIDIVKMVLAGKVNKELVSNIQLHGGKALGLCGIDGEIIVAEKKQSETDADTAAARIASCLRAENLILMTDIVGLLEDKNDESTLIPAVNVSEVPYLKKTGIISGGMIPKIDCCVEAVRRGVKKTCIIDGRVPHSILIELLSNEGVGTQFM